MFVRVQGLLECRTLADEELELRRVSPLCAALIAAGQNFCDEHSAPQKHLRAQRHVPGLSRLRALESPAAVQHSSALVPAKVAVCSQQFALIAPGN